MTIDYSARARALVGTRFRPQGRNELGLDCIGLVLATYDIPRCEVRRDYRLRGDQRAEIEAGLSRYFRPVPQAQLRGGDVMLMKVAEDQLHLGVRTDAGFVHAHASIGRVVETPGLPEWRVVRVFRKRARARS
jgi:hypothetical protein